jgi:hypothetical protein
MFKTFLTKAYVEQILEIFSLNPVAGWLVGLKRLVKTTSV